MQRIGCKVKTDDHDPNVVNSIEVPGRLDVVEIGCIDSLVEKTIPLCEARGADVEDGRLVERLKMHAIRMAGGACPGGSAAGENQVGLRLAGSQSGKSISAAGVLDGGSGGTAQ